MKLATTISSERGKEIVKTANEYLLFDLTVNKKTIGQVELYLFNDIGDRNCTDNEWILKYRPHPAEDWNIIAQDNT